MLEKMAFTAPLPPHRRNFDDGMQRRFGLEWNWSLDWLASVHIHDFGFHV